MAFTDQHTSHIFAELEVPEGLLARIIGRITQAQRRQIKFQLVAQTFLAGLSLLVFIPALYYAIGEFYSSGFSAYVSLLFSDHSAVISFWHEFLLSLVESLPSFSILLLLCSFGAFVWSLSRVVKNARTAFLRVA